MAMADAITTEITTTVTPTLDRLAPDLVWKIFDHVPDSVLNLRLTSQLLKLRVDEYAFHGLNTQLVGTVEISGKREDIIDISLTVYDARAFKSRLIRSFPFQKLKIFERTLYDRTYTFKMSFDFRVDDQTILESLGQCIGIRICKAVLIDCNSSAHQVVFSKILEEIYFDQLDVNINRFSPYAVIYLLEAINSHNFEKISLNVREFEETVNPVNLLLELASLVRSIDIYQDVVIGHSAGANFLFGVSNGDWAPIILDMFTRKLDKLVIYSSCYREYLSAQSVQLLAERLPMLGKKIFFNASCSQFVENRKFTSSGHSVRVDHTSLYPLSITHSSRKYESDK